MLRRAGARPFISLRNGAGSCLRVRFCASHTKFPRAVGLYDPLNEKDSCGVGFVANLTNVPDKSVVSRALSILCNMSHRGGAGCEPASGDGAGALFGMPDAFFRDVAARELNITLPEAGQYGVGMVFMPQDAKKRRQVHLSIEKEVRNRGYTLAAWRTVPTDASSLGPTAAAAAPFVEQCFITPSASVSAATLERDLYLIRKTAEHTLADYPDLYFCSLSSQTIVYKGMLNPDQVAKYFPDINNSLFTSQVAMVHSRFSTNTYPSWSRAQPFRLLCHNGEINTVRGNMNSFRSQQSAMSSPLLPSSSRAAAVDAVTEHQSDSANLDSVLDLLVKGSDRTLPESILTLVPQAWEHDAALPQATRDFYAYSACAMEPWDGPALLGFCDGKLVGASMDRNGLRPGRYTVTNSQQVIFASEAGVVHEVKPEEVLYKGRIQPGKMFLVDLEKNQIVHDDDIKQTISSRRPYGEWIAQHLKVLPSTSETMPRTITCASTTASHVREEHMKLFGLTDEVAELLLLPMFNTKKEALGSMGNDAALACLSTLPQSPFEYFKQLFAQVTNPPIDSVRESCVMSLACPIGPKGNLLDTSEKVAKRMVLDTPVLTLGQLKALRDNKDPRWKSVVIDTTYPRNATEMVSYIDQVCRDAASAIVAKNATTLVMSDAAAGEDRMPIPSLLITGAVQKHLVALGLRPRAALVMDVGDAYTVHHMCMLTGYGADAVYPRSAYDALATFHEKGQIPDQTYEQSVHNYLIALEKGIFKVMGKMGISTMQSYKGAQLFEAVGLGSEVMKKCFPGTQSRLKGVGFETFHKDVSTLHRLAYPVAANATETVNRDSQYNYRMNGEQHYNTPANMAYLQAATRQNSHPNYMKYSEDANNQSRNITLRGQLSFKKAPTAIPIEEVEPAANIVKRFATGAMSLGSISAEAHETLAIAMNRIGGKSNSGEGGEDAQRYVPLQSGDSKKSRIKQIASGRFGVTSNYLANADVLQIKMAQGAKPGEGGELPGYKVIGDIARIRHSTPGVGLISPPPHHDIYSIEDLAQLIHDLKNANPGAVVSVKLVSEAGVGVVAAGVAKAKADHIVISGGDGGTGASAWTGVKHAGLPWELGLAETQQALVMSDMRSRVVLQTDGQMKTGRDVAVAFLLGAEECGFATAPLIAMGCIMMRKCHLNTCPVGIATQDPELRKKFTGTPEQVVNYFFMVAEEVRSIMSELGFRSVDEMIGRSDMLERLQAIESANSKAALLDMTPILTPSRSLHATAGLRQMIAQDHGLDKALDLTLISKAAAALDHQAPVSIGPLQVHQTNRTIGAMLSHEISKRYGESGLPPNTVTVHLKGTAGQSVGAFLAKGVHIDLEGEANDYAGKGLSGGILAVKPHADSSPEFIPENNIIVGNVALYGATSGSAYFRGQGGERFAVRNSGASACVEGIGSHGCEYMTGGRVVVLGSVGANFAAGMSGGIAYILDSADNLKSRVNMEMVSLDTIADEDEANAVKRIITEHYKFTGSTVAARALENWPTTLKSFTRVMPNDYRRVLEEQAAVARGEALKKAAKPIALKDNARAFIDMVRQSPSKRSATERLGDWEDIYPAHAPEAETMKQAARCMDCGTPFCHIPHKGGGCPINNLIPEWNKLVKQGKWQEAYESLSRTNNFPEFTGRVCPAPCEQACVANLATDAVAIKSVEYAIIDKAFESGWVQPAIPPKRTGLKVSVIGSGPAGLSAADELNKLGHTVTVYERADRIGGLLMYGIPNMKLPKDIVDRRIAVMAASGINFVTGAEIGVNVSAAALRDNSDAVLLATGATKPRDMPVEGRNLKGVVFASEFLNPNTRRLVEEGPAALQGESNGNFISAKNKRVVVIGGGDTGCDAIGTSLRHGCTNVVNFELMNQPPASRRENNPWPEWGQVYRVDYGHEEAKEKFGSDPRRYHVLTKGFVNDGAGNVSGVKVVEVEWIQSDAGMKMQEVAGSESVVPADLVVLALGYVGPEQALLQDLDVATDNRSNVNAMYGSFNTESEGIFAAGDCRRGQSLVVWAINEGRMAAQNMHQYLLAANASSKEQRETPRMMEK